MIKLVLSIEPGSKEASFIHQQGSSYLVETTARVILFDIPAPEADAALVRRSSSLLSHAGDHPHRSFRRKHSGLMSWPEHFYKQDHKQRSEGAGRQTNSLSARAMQLSIYGSMVCQYRITLTSLNKNLLLFPILHSKFDRLLSSTKNLAFLQGFERRIHLIFDFSCLNPS